MLVIFQWMILDFISSTLKRTKLPLKHDGLMTQDELKSKLSEWIFGQAVSTVLLCGILGFMGYAVIHLVPAHLQQIEDGYRRNAEILSTSLEALAKSHDADREMFIRLLSGESLKDPPFIRQQYNNSKREMQDMEDGSGKR